LEAFERFIDDYLFRDDPMNVLKLDLPPIDARANIDHANLYLL